MASSASNDDDGGDDDDDALLRNNSHPLSPPRILFRQFPRRSAQNGHVE